MHHGQIFFPQGELFRSQDIGILQAHIVFFIEEAFSLHSGHIENIQLGHDLLHRPDFPVKMSGWFHHFFHDIPGNMQFLRGDKDKFHIFIPHQRFNQRVYRPAELQIAAEADGHAADLPLFPADCEQIG